MTKIVVKDEGGTLILDIEVRSDGSVTGMAKDGYDLYIDGEETETSVRRS